jgi:hypothetical protein
MGNTKITLELTLDQANVVMQSLAKQPFEAVADLIGLVREQAMRQIEAAKAPEQAPAAE